jgi:hypothetical protein
MVPAIKILILCLLTVSGFAQVVQERNARGADRIIILKDGFRVPIRDTATAPALLNYSGDSSRGGVVYDSTLQKLCFWTGVRWVCLDDAGGGGSIAYDSIKQINDTTIAFQRSNFTQDTLVFTYAWAPPPSPPSQTDSIFATSKSAYSIRRITDSATVCIRVRRSSDNAQQNIGFVNGYIDTASLKTFVGAGDGFIVTWFDQKGYANVNQTTTAQQPRIVSSGNVYYSNGNVSIEFGFSGASRMFHSSNYAQPNTFFAVARRNNASQTADVIFDSYSNVVHVLYNKGTSESTNNRYSYNAGTLIQSTINGTANITLLSVLSSGASSLLRTNGAADVAANAGTSTLTGLSFGNVRGNPSPIVSNYHFKGGISELIIFNSNESANFTTIENNINSFYAIY